MSNAKQCPLLRAALLANPAHESEHEDASTSTMPALAQCIEHKCQWWAAQPYTTEGYRTEGDCAITLGPLTKDGQLVV